MYNLNIIYLYISEKWNYLYVFIIYLFCSTLFLNKYKLVIFNIKPIIHKYILWVFYHSLRTSIVHFIYELLLSTIA